MAATTTENTSTPKKIGVIVCSTRKPRAGLQITQWVYDTLFASTSAPGSNVSLSLIDLEEWNFPLFNEPGIPSQIHNPDEYENELTRKWSREISSYAGFVFVTPQYNWGYPAGLKNAIDYLFNEWKGKHAMIVSYGGHGGGKAAAQLKQILQAVRMEVVEKMPALTFLDRKHQATAAYGKDLGLDAHAEDGTWKSEQGEIVDAFADLVGKVEFRQ